jgi:predicted enzyme related to lactoylglutathione lyase
MSDPHNPVGWFEIYVQDMERARKFYETLFQVTLQPIDNPTGNPEMELLGFPMQMGAPGCAGSLVRMPGKDSGGGGTIIYFWCEDCAVEAARAADAGGRLDQGKMSIGQYGWIAFVIDTEGNRIGLHSMN